jgi:hypothetical protein
LLYGEGAGRHAACRRATARYQEALAARRRDVPRVSPAQPTPARRAVEASARLSALSRAQLAAGRRGPGALHRMHLLLARWLEY